MAKVDYNSFFSENLTSGINTLKTELLSLDKLIEKMAKGRKVDLFGGAKTLKANEEAIADMVKLMEQKKKLEEINIKLNAKLAKIEKDKEKQNKKIAAQEEKRLKRQKQIEKDLKANLTAEQKLFQTLELKKEQLKEIIQEEGRTSEAYIRQREEIAELTREYKEAQKIQKLQIELDATEEGSIDQLRAKKKLLEIQIGKLSKAQREETEEGRALVQELQETNSAILEFDGSVKDGRSNVGRYAESLQGFENELSGIRDELGALNPVLSLIGNKLQEQAEKWREARDNSRENRNEIKRNGASLKSFGKIAAGIGIAGVATFFLKTADGFEDFRLILAQAKGWVLTLVGALGDIGRNIVARFKNIGTEIGAFFKNIGLQAMKFALETKKAFQELNPFGDGATKETEDGLKNVTAEIKELERATKESNAEVEKTKVNFADLFKTAKETGDVFGQIEKAKIANEKLNRELSISISELQKQQQLLQDIAEDDTINFDRRRKLYKESADIATRSATIALEMQNKQIELLQKEAKEIAKLGLKDIEIKDKISQAIIERNGLEQEYIETLRNNSELRKKAISDELEVDLDANLQRLASLEQTLDQNLSNEKISIDERRKLLTDFQKTENDFYAKRIQTIAQNSKEAAAIELERINKEIALLESKGSLSSIEAEQMARLIEMRDENNNIISKEVDLTEILAETDATRLIEKVRGLKLGEKWELRTLEVVGEKNDAISTTKDKLTELDNEYISSAENQYNLEMTMLRLLKDERDETGRLLISKEEYSRRAIEAERTLLQAQLDRYKAYNEADLTQEQLDDMQRLLIMLNKLNEEMEKFAGFKPPETVFDKFFNSMSKGFKGTDEALEYWKTQTEQSLSTIANSFSEFFGTINTQRQENLQNELDAINQELQAKQKQLDAERDRKEAGDANDFELKEKEVENLKNAEEQKRAELEKSQEQQAKLAAAQQAVAGIIAASNMLIAASEVFKENAGIPFVGVAIATAAVATMLATFVGVKKQLSAFHDGTERVQGPSGRDKVPAMVEKGERIVPTSVNNQLPRNVKNKDLPKLVKLGLGKISGGDGINALAITKEAEEKNNDKILDKIYDILANDENIINFDGKTLRVERRGGKIFRTTKMN